MAANENLKEHSAQVNLYRDLKKKLAYDEN